MKVKHPDFDDVINDVPDADGDAWLEQGWLKVSRTEAKKLEDEQPA